MVRWTRVAAVSGAVVVTLTLVAWAILHNVVTGIARDNLSAAEFSRAHLETPATYGLAFENITITSDGLALAGWWIPADEDGATVILVHGFGSNMSKVVRQWAPNLHTAGHNVLTIDLRNHGASADTPSRRVTFGVDESDDVLAAVSYVRGNAVALGVDPDRIVLYGESMGGAAVLRAAAQHPPGVIGVLSDSSFASLAFQAHIDGREQGYPSFMVTWVLDRMDDLAPSPPSQSRPDRALADIAVPVFLAHCEDDTRVQVASFHRLSVLAPDATTWLGVCANGPSIFEHVDGWTFPAYNATVRSFVAGL